MQPVDRARVPGGSSDSGMSRRRALAVLGMGAGVAAISLGRALAEPAPAGPATAQPALCVLTPEVTQGPYYLQHSLVRQDIAEDKSGFPLNLIFTVVDYTN